jgi:hypothetical protein
MQYLTQIKGGKPGFESSVGDSALLLSYSNQTDGIASETEWPVLEYEKMCRDLNPVHPEC